LRPIKDLQAFWSSAASKTRNLVFHPKVFHRPADKGFSNGLYALFTKGEPKLMALVPSLS
jgi:hypothetical protein